MNIMLALINQFLSSLAQDFIEEIVDPSAFSSLAYS